MTSSEGEPLFFNYLRDMLELVVLGLGLLVAGKLYRVGEIRL